MSRHDEQTVHPPDSPAEPAAGQDNGVTRRSFIQTLGVSAATGALTQAHSNAAETVEADAGPTELGPDAFDIELRINGRPMRTRIDPATTLMEALRWHYRMTGTKEVCDRGACGGCSVLVDGTLIASCMMLAVDAMGTEIETVEGVADGEQLDAVQEAFIKHDALQCGYCTPGLIMATKALLDEHPRPTMEQIKHGLSGNLCRCGTYTNVFNAVLEASGQQPIMDREVKGGGA